jgi:hypothetical protein
MQPDNDLRATPMNYLPLQNPSSPDDERTLLEILRADAWVVRMRALQACILADDIDPTLTGEARKKQIRKSKRRSRP